MHDIQPQPKPDEDLTHDSRQSPVSETVTYAASELACAKARSSPAAAPLPQSTTPKAGSPMMATACS